MKKPHLFVFFVALLLGAFLNNVSHAAAIRDVAIQSVYSEFGGRGASNVIGNTGLFGDAHTTAPAGNMWLTATAGANDFTNAFIQFDLGAVRTLDHVRVWNYNEAGALTRRGIQRADIYTSVDGVTFTTNFPDTFFSIAPGTFGTNFAQTISLGGVSARFIGFKVLTNHVTTTADNFVGLSKVKFYDTNVAPFVTLATRSFFGDRVTVLFSDSVTSAAATNLANYTISNSGTNVMITNAVFDLYPNRVVLQTATALNSNLVYTVRATNITDVFTSVKVDATPVTIEPELVLWLKGDVGVVADGSGFVSQWNDQSRASNHVAQADPASQPTLATDANGNAVVRFSPTPQYLEAPHAPSLVVRSDYTIFSVINVVDFSTFNAIVGKTTVNQPAAFDFYTASTSGKPNFLRGNGFSSTGLGGVSNVVAGQTVVLGGIVRGTNATTYFNGAFNGAAVMTTGVGDNGNPLRVGTRGDLFTRMNGDIAEIMVFRGAVSDAERTAINAYLGAKYGVAIINLVFNQHPQSQSVLEGQTATFSVNVTSSSTTVNYQWQRFGTNIPNATNVTYTTPVLTQADNNSTFRVQVSIPGSSPFSDTATLTVSADQELPVLQAAGRRISNPAEVVMVFSEAIAPASLSPLSNFVIDNGGVVTAAVMGSLPNEVILTTTGLNASTAYNITVQNVRDLFNNVMAETTLPLGISPAGLALWLRAGDGVTADASGFVSLWDDQSGNGNNAFQPIGPENAPTLVTNVINGNPVIRYDGVGQYLAVNPSPSMAITADMTVYVVARFDDFGSFRGIIGKTGGPGGNLPAPYDFYLLAGTGEPRFYRGDAIVSAQVTGTAAPSLNVPHIVSVSMGGTTVNHYLDGQANGSGTLATTIADDAATLVGIGTRNDLVTLMKGDFAEILVFATALSAADRVAIDNYLGNKYGILVGLLPSLSIARTGDAITLTWPASATDFVLQNVAVLGQPFGTATNAVSNVDGTNTVTLNPADAPQFYRLRRP